MTDDAWKSHIALFENRQVLPAATLRKALELFSIKKALTKDAIDLGFGSGVDTVALLRQDWQVLGIDSSAHALSTLTKQLENVPQELYTLKTDTFEKIVSLPASSLVNASFSLPFCHPDAFGKLWDMIVDSVRPGGRFAGHFFGQDDSWSPNSNMTFHTKKKVEQLLRGFEIEALKEVNERGKTIDGSVKHWHVFHVVASKK